MIRLTIALLSILPIVTAADTVGWRTDWTGKYASAKPVVEWSKDTNVIWKTPTPKWGNATPVIVDSRLFICAEPATLVCVNKADGKILWQKGYITEAEISTKAPKTHKVAGYSSMTPVSDGTHIYVLSGYGTVACFDLDGNRLWLETVNTPTHKWGTSASPVIADGKLIVHIVPKVTALDLKTGKQAWQTTSKGSWGTPLVVPIGGQEAVYVSSGDLIRAADGAVISKNQPLPWTCPISDGNALYIIDQNGAHALKLPKALNDGQALEPIWTLPTTKPRKNRYYASPIIHDGLLYAITRKSHFVVIDATTGKLVYEEDLKLGGTTYPSLVLAGNHLLVSSDNGKTMVIEPGKEFKAVGTNVLEKFRSTPVFDGDRMYIRGLETLYCIGKK